MPHSVILPAGMTWITRPFPFPCEATYMDHAIQLLTLESPDSEWQVRCSCGATWTLKANELHADMVDKFRRHVENAERHKVTGDTKPL